LSLERCQILNPRDQAGSGVAGPRFWLGDLDASHDGDDDVD